MPWCHTRYSPRVCNSSLLRQFNELWLSFWIVSCVYSICLHRYCTMLCISSEVYICQERLWSWISTWTKKLSKLYPHILSLWLLCTIDRVKVRVLKHMPICALCFWVTYEPYDSNHRQLDNGGNESALHIYIYYIYQNHKLSAKWHFYSSCWPYNGSTRAAWRFKSTPTWLIVQQLLQANYNENIKALQYVPFEIGIQRLPVIHQFFLLNIVTNERFCWFCLTIQLLNTFQLSPMNICMGFV